MNLVHPLSATAPLDGQSTLRLRRESGQVPSRENSATQVREEQQRLFGFNSRARGKRKATTTNTSTCSSEKASEESCVVAGLFVHAVD